MKSERDKLKANILKYIIYSFLGSISIASPISIIYFQEHLGLSLTQIGTTNSLFSILVALLGLFAGHLGDKHSYKLNITIGNLGIVLGSTGYALATKFIHVLCSEFFWAIGYGFILSSLNAFLYQTLKNLKWENKFNLIKGRGTAFALLGLSLGATIGGFLAKISLSLPMILSPLIFLLPLGVSLGYHEPKRDHKKKNVSLKRAFKYLLNHKNLLFFFSLTLSFSIPSALSYFFLQPILNEVELPITLFGVVISLTSILSAIGSLISHKLNSLFGYKKILRFLIFTYLFSFGILTTKNIWGVLLGVTFLWLCDGIQIPLTSDLINRELTEFNRATINSFYSIIQRIGMAILLPLMGWVADNKGISNVYLFIFFFTIIILLPSIIYGKKHKHLI